MVEDEAETPPENTAETDIQNIVTRVVEEAIRYTEDELSPLRAKAADYYAGKPFGNEQEGRSQLVMTEVRDGVQSVLPSLMRVFLGPERVAEFRGTKPGQAAQARAATRLVEEVFLRRSNGFLETHSVLKDGLIKKLGVYKWGTTPRTETKTFEQVAPAESLDIMLEQMAQDPTISVTLGEEGPEGVPVKITQTIEHKDPWVAAVPPEEFIFSRSTRSTEDFLFIGHRSDKRRHELMAMGFSAEMLEEHGSMDRELTDNPEAQARDLDSADMEDPDAGVANDEILYVEGYMWLADNPEDPDSPASLRRICTLGTKHHIVVNEPATHPRFSVYIPDPEPHTLNGQSWADRLMDMQRFKTDLARGASDSLGLSIFPRTVVLEGKANIQDVQNTEIGAIIREQVPMAVRELTHTFMGGEALNMLSYADAVIQSRTGKDRGTAGLAADSLQSSTREGVTAVIATSQEQIELLARIFAETAFKPMFQGVYRMLCEEATEPFLLEIDGEYQEVDPRQMDPDMHLQINVALGTSFVDSRVNDLLQVATQQKEILTVMGPSNPLVTMKMYRDTLARVLEARGHDPSEFFMTVPADWQPEPQPPQKTPEEAIAEATIEVERMKTQKELEIKEAELALKREESQQKMQLERDKLSESSRLAELKIQADAETQLEIERMRIEMQARKLETDAALKGSAQAAQKATADGNLEVQVAKTVLDAERVELEGERLTEEVLIEREKLRVQEEQIAAQAEAARLAAASKPATGGSNE